MKKASRVLLSVGGALHIVEGVTFLLVALAFLIISIVFLSSGTMIIATGVEEEGQEAASLTMMIISIVYLCVSLLVLIPFGIVSFVAAKYTFNSRDSEDKGKYIGSIIFGGIFDNPPAVIGGIFGIIALDHFKEPKKQPAEEQVADEVVE